MVICSGDGQLVQMNKVGEDGEVVRNCDVEDEDELKDFDGGL